MGTPIICTLHKEPSGSVIAAEHTDYHALEHVVTLEGSEVIENHWQYSIITDVMYFPLD